MASSGVSAQGNTPYLVRPFQRISTGIPYAFAIIALIGATGVAFLACKGYLPSTTLYGAPAVGFIALTVACLLISKKPARQITESPPQVPGSPPSFPSRQAESETLPAPAPPPPSLPLEPKNPEQKIEKPETPAIPPKPLSKPATLMKKAAASSPIEENNFAQREDIWTNILSYLDLHDLLSVSKSCFFLNALAANNLYWEPIGKRLQANKMITLPSGPVLRWKPTILNHQKWANKACHIQAIPSSDNATVLNIEKGFLFFLNREQTQLKICDVDDLSEGGFKLNLTSSEEISCYTLISAQRNNQLKHKLSGYNLFAGTKDGNIFVWRLDNCINIYSLNCEDPVIRLYTKGNLLIAHCKTSLVIWDFEKAQQLKRVSSVNCEAPLQIVGNTVYFSVENCFAKMDLSTFEMTTYQEKYDDKINRIIIYGEKKYVSSIRTLKIWEGETCIKSLTQSSDIKNMVLVGNKIIISTHLSGTVIYDLNGEIASQFPRLHLGMFSTEQGLVVSVFNSKKPVIREFTLYNGYVSDVPIAEIDEIKTAEGQHGMLITGMLVTAGLVITFTRGLIKLWDLGSGAFLNEIPLKNVSRVFLAGDRLITEGSEINLVIFKKAASPAGASAT